MNLRGSLYVRKSQNILSELERNCEMGEAVLNAYAQQLVDLTLNKTRYDKWDLQWYVEGPFWRRTCMKFSRTYKQIPDYEIGDMKHGKSLNDILEEGEALYKNLIAYSENASEDEEARVKYLIENVGNLVFRSRMLMGEKFTFDEMTDGLYNVVCPETDYKLFDDIKEEINNALPWQGSFTDKIKKFRDSIRIPRESLLKVLTDTTKWWHDSAVANMDVTGNSMPRVRVRELADPNWVFISILFGYDYNHIEYERNFNLLYPWTPEKVIEYIGHEMEPGHLTCFEKRTQKFIDECWPEMSVISQHSGANSLGEGSARYASMLSFNNSMEEKVEFEKEYIFKPSGIDMGLTELMPLWHKYCEIPDFGKLEASRHDWNGDWNDNKIIDFVESYGFVNVGEGRSLINTFKTDDPGHYVAHYYAREIVKEYFQSLEIPISEQWKVYEKLCSSHATLKSLVDRKVKL